MALADAWYRRAAWLHLLRPLAVVFTLLARWRRRRLSRQQQASPVPVVVVGNISVGGTGKTPVVLALAALFEQHGWRCAVISRGYGGHARHYPLHVTADTDVRHSGDEARLMRRHLRGPLVVDPDRARALASVVGDHPCDVVISDDGLQHYRLPRDIEMVVVDGRRGLGNGFCLPAGPLREPPSRLRQVDYVLINGDAVPPLPAGIPAPVCFGLKPVGWVNVRTGQRVTLASFRLLLDADDNTRIPAQAIAGIGHPQRFFDQLTAMGFDVSGHAFSDHHAYRASDLAFANKSLLLMTEKDAVKCQHFASENGAGDNWWYLQVQAGLPAALEQDMIARVEACMAKRRAG